MPAACASAASPQMIPAEKAARLNTVLTSTFFNTVRSHTGTQRGGTVQTVRRHVNDFLTLVLIFAANEPARLGSPCRCVAQGLIASPFGLGPAEFHAVFFRGLFPRRLGAGLAHLVKVDRIAHDTDFIARGDLTAPVRLRGSIC